MKKVVRGVAFGALAGVVLGFIVGLVLFEIFGGGSLFGYELAAGLVGAIFGGLFGAFYGGMLHVPRSYGKG